VEYDCPSEADGEINAGIPMMAMHFLTTLVSPWKVIHTWGDRAAQKGSIQK
jgi:hypothetical protein